MKKNRHEFKRLLLADPGIMWKTNLLAFLCFHLFSAASGQCSEDMIITGVLSGPLEGRKPEAVELYVFNNVPSMGIYGMGTSTDGGGSEGKEHNLVSNNAKAGWFLYTSTDGTAFYSFLKKYQNMQFLRNMFDGNDAIELYKNGKVIDVFGYVNVNGTGQPWEYKKGWAYRKDGSCPSAVFDPSQWIFSGPNALDGVTKNSQAAKPYPRGTYSPIAPPQPPTTEVQVQTTSDELSTAGPLPAASCEEVRTSTIFLEESLDRKPSNKPAFEGVETPTFCSVKCWLMCCRCMAYNKLSSMCSVYLEDANSLNLEINLGTDFYIRH